MTPAEQQTVADLLDPTAHLPPAVLADLSIGALTVLQSYHAEQALIAEQRAAAFRYLFHLLDPWLDRHDSGFGPAIERATRYARTHQDSWAWAAVRAKTAVALLQQHPSLLDNQ